MYYINYIIIFINNNLQNRHFLEKQISSAGKTPPKIILWTLDPKDVICNYHNFWNTKVCEHFTIMIYYYV